MEPVNDANTLRNAEFLQNAALGSSISPTRPRRTFNCRQKIGNHIVNGSSGNIFEVKVPILDDRHADIGLPVFWSWQF